MQLNFPAYLNKKSEIIKGTGNAVIPEGTCYLENEYTSTRGLDGWNCKKLLFQQKTLYFIKNIVQNTDYQILTSNRR
jgi:hypothetical protein